MYFGDKSINQFFNVYDTTLYVYGTREVGFVFFLAFHLHHPKHVISPVHVTVDLTDVVNTIRYNNLEMNETKTKSTRRKQRKKNQIRRRGGEYTVGERRQVYDRKEIIL